MIMTSFFPALLTVFFDGRCGMCRSEMAAVAQLDARHELHLIDCSADDFDARPWLAEGVSRADMMQSLHVRDVLGDWHRGADAVGLLYATVDAPWLARLWTHPWLRPLMRSLYPVIARNRYVLSKLGFAVLAPRVMHLFSKRSRKPVCKHGACDARAWM
jgi:predicted DCC family thiol-disulfide oxidoreductase YuxK